MLLAADVTTGGNRGSVAPASAGIAKRAMEPDPPKTGTRPSAEIATRPARGTQRGQEWHTRGTRSGIRIPRASCAKGRPSTTAMPTSGPGSSRWSPRPSRAGTRACTGPRGRASLVLPASRSTHRQDLVGGIAAHITHERPGDAHEQHRRRGRRISPRSWVPRRLTSPWRSEHSEAISGWYVTPEKLVGDIDGGDGGRSGLPTSCRGCEIWQGTVSWVWSR